MSEHEHKACATRSQPFQSLAHECTADARPLSRRSYGQWRENLHRDLRLIGQLHRGEHHVPGYLAVVCDQRQHGARARVGEQVVYEPVDFRSFIGAEYVEMQG
jgi:hypothetical protein